MGSLILDDWLQAPSSHCYPPTPPPHPLPHLTMAHRLWMGSMILDDWLQASAKRVVDE